MPRPPKWQVVSSVKCMPVITTRVPPEVGPSAGESQLMLGNGVDSNESATVVVPVASSARRVEPSAGRLGGVWQTTWLALIHIDGDEE